MTDAPLDEAGRLRDEILRRLPELNLGKLEDLDQFIDELLADHLSKAEITEIMAKVA